MPENGGRGMLRLKIITMGAEETGKVSPAISEGASCLDVDFSELSHQAILRKEVRLQVYGHSGHRLWRDKD